MQNVVFESLDEGAELKIVDFGFARRMPNKKSGEGMRTPCFTLHYAAPEVLRQAAIGVKDEENQNQPAPGQQRQPQQRQLGYDENCDLWSLGVILVRKVILVDWKLFAVVRLEEVKFGSCSM